MPTETKSYTPGPWRLAGGSGTVPKLHVMGSTKELFAVAHIFGETDEERTANARLVASAPEMLEALKAVLRDVKESNGLHSIDMAVEVAIEILIAKVEGR